ncbi:MAG: hypothetical protein KF773_18545 [Deltaproteobacteria bacterium]|nr:hypothetical protein [Deltaproteobacteria bacterium]
MYDPHGRYPLFLERFHGMFARVMNLYRGTRENFWSSSQTSVIHLVDREAVLEKLVYVATNPVKAHLVATHGAWPGVNTLKTLLEGRSLEARRPTQFGRKLLASLQHRPRLPEHPLIGDRAAFLEELRERVEAMETTLRAEVAASGKKFLGRAGVRTQSWRTRSTTVETKKKRFRTFAAVCPHAMKRARLARREFLAAYLGARARWRDGNRDAVFPPGTYWLHVHARVRVAPDQISDSVATLTSPADRSDRRS